MEASKRKHAGMRENGKLKKMVEELQVLVKEQEAVIQMAMASRLAPTPAKGPDADEISQRQRELEKKFRMVENERRQSMSLVDQLEKVRPSLVSCWWQRGSFVRSVLMMLEQDKLVLQQERLKFEEEKRQFRNALKLWAPGMGAGKFLAKAITPLGEKAQNVENSDEGSPISMRFSDVKEVRAAGDATLKEVQRVYETEFSKVRSKLPAGVTGFRILLWTTMLESEWRKGSWVEAIEHPQGR